MLLRVPRVDASAAEDSFVLVQVSSNGPQTFDLKLIGTDSEFAYAVSLKNSQSLKLKDKKSNLTKDQWETALSVFLVGAERKKEDSFLDDMELIAKVEEGVSTTIGIRKKVQGITQNLGSIVLLADENEGDNIDMFAWCGSQVQAKALFVQEFEKLLATAESQEEKIKTLTDGLAELIKAKADHEAQLLEKFSLLLNEKKLKIRDQQRLLASANVDPEKLAGVEASRTNINAHSPGPSRKGKRKANTKDESDESDDGFENMEVDDPEPPAEESDVEHQRTPEDSTADEEESDDDIVAPTRKSPRTTKGKELAGNTSTKASEPAELPAKRELPFNNKKKQAPVPDPEPVASSSTTAAAEGSETESDDEL